MHKKQIRPLARLHGYWIYKQFLSRTGAWTEREKRAYVFERLKQTLIQADEGIPFYRERFRQAGFNPKADFGSVEDLRHLPILTKADVRTHHTEMVDRRFLSTSVVANTSGTTGQPMTMRLGLGYIAVDYACMYRFWAQAGYTFRAPCAAIRSYVPASAAGPLWKYNYWQNTLYMSAYHLKPSNSQDYVQALLKFRPAFIRGYASSVNVLAEYALPYREQFDFVRGIFTASETLLDYERKTIEQTFGKKLYDWYGMTEPAVVITETANHEGMEVNWEYGYPEFLEGEGLESNERRLMATSLHNPVMPFIRYQTDDIVRMAGGVASPGQIHPKIEAVVGRKDEYILTPDGGRLPSLNFYSLLQGYADILKFQFVQRDLSHVTMKIAVRPGARNVPAMVSKLHEETMRRLGAQMNIEIEQTEEFERSPDGKTPAFKRLFRPEAVHANSAALASQQYK
ncbi:MAG: Histidinol-phosphate aminotransferase [Verrucomicrobiales bacterium]|nr:Histidinol-phosphate aminotransferase [Verrucomicrobiales bacterium]